mmetsp:Transcript_4732/g.10265  ORF Transcript_4732/g.10265 Transcript_4732/m.10265 type:complete len:876 (-) Transcript_4732:168-2795(-)
MRRQNSSSSRLPFRPRDVNSVGRSSSTASVTSSKGSGGSKASSSVASKYLHSYLESSNNPNNQRLMSMSSGTDEDNLSSLKGPGRPSVAAAAAEQNSSTVANTGAPGLKIPTFASDEKGFGGLAAAREEQEGGSGTRDVPRKSRSATATTATTTSTAPPARRSSSSRQKPVVTPEDHEEIEIVEHRKKLNGDGFTVHKYLRGRLLGKGGFAKVYWCTSLDTNRHYAVKIVPKANLVKSRARQKLQAEIKIHRSLKHGNVCEYKHFFEDKENCYILLELCQNQSMNEMIKRRKRLTEPEVKYYMKQLLEAVQYMHDVNVIHRDLKLGNLFLDKNLTVKVGDFGLATRLSNSEEKRKTICGTPNYIAPEVIDGNKEKRGHSFEVDVWSMGVICFTTLVGKPPYESKDVKSTYQRILANQYEFPSHIPISRHARELISAMLQTNPQKRPTLEQMSQHPFFTHDASNIPSSIPLSGTHVAPDWKFDSNGIIFAVEKESDEKYRRPTISSRRRKHVPGDSQEKKNVAAASQQPLTSRNVNSNAGRQDYVEAAHHEDRLRQSKVQTGGSTKFSIFNDEAGAASNRHEKAPQAARSSDVVNEQITKKLAALTVEDPKDSLAGNSSPLSPADKDVQALEVMHNRLRDAFEAAESGSKSRGAEKKANVDDRVEMEGSEKWVTRYVDYTSKYGLGFLLNDGSAGVYFNDSTKSVLAKEGETFLYVERRKVARAINATEHDYEMHTLSSYPESLQKKVTLLKHFRNYLVEQQRKAEEEGEVETTATPAVEVVDSRTDTSMIFLKKWVRTKHAILFRLSNETVQVVFYDHTEILLSHEAELVTYVDKKRQRNTFKLDQMVLDPSAEVGKRLKYAKDILKQLVPGSKS